jgi:hypothetical protein
LACLAAHLGQLGYSEPALRDAQLPPYDSLFSKTHRQSAPHVPGLAARPGRFWPNYRRLSLRVDRASQLQHLVLDARCGLDRLEYVATDP